MRHCLNRFLDVVALPRFRVSRWLGAAVAVCLSVSSAVEIARAGGGPQNVAVIVNPNDPGSLEVANEYIRLRQIPAGNVIYVPWQKDVRSASSTDFVAKMIEPIFRELNRRGLTSQINCIAYSSGFPFMVDLRGEIKAASVPPQATPVASLNSATFLYQDLLGKRAQILSLDSNAYFTPAFGDATTSAAFSSQLSWFQGREDKSGFGRTFMLSTVLGATIGRGNQVQEICDYLRRARAADGTAPKGTIYYMQNDNVRSKVRHDSFLPAVEAIKKLGVNAEIMRGSAPIKKEDVAGLTTGISHLRLRTADCRLLPGALVDNLTSAAGVLIVPATIADPQTPVSEFMRMGAAGASGTVTEPYAIPAKFPAASLHVHYVRGLSLAEAFYRSTQGPFQLLILGDPLCQPWAIAPQISVPGIADEGTIKGTVKMTPAAVFKDQRSISKFQLFVDGKLHSEIDPGKEFSFNSNAIADGWHRLVVVGIDDTPMAVQGSWAAEVVVKNGQHALQVTPTAERFSLAGDVELRIASTAADLPTKIMHNGRRVADIPGGQGTVTIKASTLGRGVVTLDAVQERDNRAVIRARPTTVQID